MATSYRMMTDKEYKPFMVSTEIFLFGQDANKDPWNNCLTWLFVQRVVIQWQASLCLLTLQAAVHPNPNPIHLQCQNPNQRDPQRSLSPRTNQRPTPVERSAAGAWCSMLHAPSGETCSFSKAGTFKDATDYLTLYSCVWIDNVLVELNRVAGELCGGI